MPYTNLDSLVLSGGFPAKFRRFTLKHLYVFLVVPLIFILVPLTNPGIPITLDFPTFDTSDYAPGKLWVWTEKGSLPALETISRFPIIGLWFVLGMIGIDSVLISKFMIILGFIIASFSFYFSFLLLFKDNGVKNDPSNDTKLRVAAIMGALFFAYNPWSFERIPHWYLWIGYAILPLFFISAIYAFKNPRNLRYIASSVFLWSFASTTPHMTVYYGLIFGAIFVAFTLNSLFSRHGIKNGANLRIKNKSTRDSGALMLLVPFLIIPFLYVLVNAYWIYPIILASQARSIAPNYLMVEGTLEFLSKEANFLNTLRLVANWQEQPYEIPVEGSLFYYVWYIASLALPVFGFSALFISRKFLKYTIAFSIFAIVGIVLAMGTQSPINYFKYVLENPVLSEYGWLVRDPDKWGFLIAFTSSFLIGISSYKILERIRRKAGSLRSDKVGHPGTLLTKRIGWKRNLAAVFFLCLMIASLGLYSYPVYVFNMLGELRPVSFPPEFDKLNRFLSGVNAENVYFLPYPLDETKWNKINRVGNIYQTHSLKPSIESSGSTGMAGMGTTNYYNFLAKSVVENRSKDIRNFIYPLGSSYLIFHNDTWDKRIDSPNTKNLELLEGINSLEGLKNVRNLGFYNIFEADGSNGYRDKNDKGPKPVSILNNNIAAVGGLDAIQSLNYLQPFFSSLNSSVFFVDQTDTSDRVEDFLYNSDYLILEKSPSYYDLLFLLVDKKYIIEPSTVSIDYDPMRLWSKTGAMDPDNGLFHPYLENRGIDTWQFDYGKGLVMTQATGANLSIPVPINETGQYDMFVRFLKNREGGMINVYLDDKLLDQINSFDERSNYFVWQKIAGDEFLPLNLKQGRHTLTLENVAGFNVINMFGIIPDRQVASLQEQVANIARKANNIHLLEAESSFYNNLGRSINGNDSRSPQNSYIYYPWDANSNSNNITRSEAEGMNSIYLRSNSSLFGQLKVPKTADLLRLELLNGYHNGHNQSNLTPTNLNDLAKNSDYFIESVKLFPARRDQVMIMSDFDRSNPSVSLAELRRPIWINHDENSLSTSTDTKNPISGTGSLRVNVRQGNESEWSTITTDHLPIDDRSLYKFSMNVSAQDVEQLHGRISYFDENKGKLGGDYITRGKDGTYEDVYLASIVPPMGAKYLRFEILIKPVTTGHTSYAIDDMKFEELRPPVISFDDRNNDFEKPIISQETRPIPVIENSVYNYSINFKAKETKPATAVTKSENTNIGIKPEHVPSVLAYFTDSNDVKENSTKYGQNASSGSILTLGPSSQVYTDLDILKQGYYSIALRANPCANCSFLTAAVEDKDGNVIRTETVPIRENMTNSSTMGYSNESNFTTNNTSNEFPKYDSAGLRWFYLNNDVYLDEGKYRIKIYSNSTSIVDLDLVIVSSGENNTASSVNSNEENGFESIDKVFNSHTVSSPAYLEEFRKINPAKYEVEIKNATRPYVMSLVETFDPLWMASFQTDKASTKNNEKENTIEPTDVSNSVKIPSIPLYSIINGFYINKTGDYRVVLEYQPQIWYMQGAIVSIVITIAILVLLSIPSIRTIFRRVRSKESQKLTNNKNQV
jgi:hypothetical protein